MRQYGLTYPQLRDGDGQRAHDFGTTGVPENFLVDPRGRLRLIWRGPGRRPNPARYVAPLLPEQPLMRRAGGRLLALSGGLAAPALARRSRRDHADDRRSKTK